MFAPAHRGLPLAILRLALGAGLAAVTLATREATARSGFIAFCDSLYPAGEEAPANIPAFESWPDRLLGYCQPAQRNVELEAEVHDVGGGAKDKDGVVTGEHRDVARVVSMATAAPIVGFHRW